MTKFGLIAFVGSEAAYCNHLLIPLLLLLLFLFTKHNIASKKHLPPAPPTLPFIGNLHQIGSLPHHSLRRLSTTYGPVMLLRLGRVPTLVISSARAAKQVLNTDDLRCCSRPPLTGTARITYGFRDLAFSPYGDYWKEMRKFCVLQLLSAKRVHSFRLVREQEVASLIAQMASHARPVDLCKMIFPCTAAIICRVAFGKSFQETGLDNERFQELLHEAMLVTGSFNAADLFPCVGWIVDWLTGLRGRTKRIFRELDAFYQDIIDHHVQTGATSQDLVGVLLKAAETGHRDGNGIAFTHNHVKAIMTNMFLGGVDSSSVCVIWAMTELARNPRVMKKAQDEVRSYTGSKGKVSETDADQLQYLKMVVKETLRMHPPSPFLIPREAMSHFKINGYNVYPKTRIEVNVYALGRDPASWKNPKEFYPERFTDSSVDFRGQNFELLPFGSGRRVCPGIQMGTAMVMLMLANLLYCFDWKLPEGMKEEDIDTEELPGLVTHKKTALELLPIKYEHQKLT